MDTKGEMRESSALGDEGGGQPCKRDEDIPKCDGSMHGIQSVLNEKKKINLVPASIFLPPDYGLLPLMTQSRNLENFSYAHKFVSMAILKLIMLKIKINHYD